MFILQLMTNNRTLQSTYYFFISLKIIKQIKTGTTTSKEEEEETTIVCLTVDVVVKSSLFIKV